VPFRQAQGPELAEGRCAQCALSPVSVTDAQTLQFESARVLQSLYGNDLALLKTLEKTLDVRVTTSLGALSPEDVCVEVVYGRLGEDDELVEPSYVPLTADDSAQAPHTRFAGSVELGNPGPFGYTIRVLPSHPLLASRADLGLVAYPDAPAGMSTGDLR